jgi:UDP-N-acetylglucosamine 2-epimerase (non-hydrolysing)
VLDGVRGVKLVEPLPYDVTVRAIARSKLVLTDSGGLQEEAPCLGKPVLVMRDETERPEGIEAGTLELVGPHRGAIVAATKRLLEDEIAYARMSRANNPYGDGHAAERIVAWLLARLRNGAFPREFSAA